MRDFGPAAACARILGFIPLGTGFPGTGQRFGAVQAQPVLDAGAWGVPLGAGSRCKPGRADSSSGTRCVIQTRREQLGSGRTWRACRSGGTRSPGTALGYPPAASQGVLGERGTWGSPIPDRRGPFGCAPPLQGAARPRLFFLFSALVRDAQTMPEGSRGISELAAGSAGAVVDGTQHPRATACPS